MGCLISSAKSLCGIQDQPLWKNVLERKVMERDIGFCLPLRNDKQDEDLLLEVEAAVAFLSSDHFDDKQYNDITHRLKDVASFSRDDKNVNMNESPDVRKSNYPDNKHKDQSETRRRGTTRKSENVDSDEMNEYTFCEESKSIRLEDRLKFPPYLSDDDTHSTEEQVNEEDVELTELLYEVSKHLDEAYCFKSLEKLLSDDCQELHLQDDLLAFADEVVGKGSERNQINLNKYRVEDVDHICQDASLLVGRESVDITNIGKQHDVINVKKETTRDPTLDSEVIQVGDDISGSRNSPVTWEIDDINLQVNSTEGYSSMNISSALVRQNRNWHMKNEEPNIKQSASSTYIKSEEEDKSSSVSQDDKSQTQSQTPKSIASNLKVDFTEKLDQVRIFFYKSRRNKDKSIQRGDFCCPIEDCEVPNCLTTDQFVNDERDADKKGIAGLMLRVKTKIDDIFFEDISGFQTARPVHRAVIRAAKVTVQDEVRLKNDPLHLTKDPRDFEQFLQTIQYSLQGHRKQNMRAPMQIIADYLGFQRKLLPKNPFKGHVIDNMIHQIVRALQLIFSPCTTLFHYMKRFESTYHIETACLVDELLTERSMILKFYKWKHDTLLCVLDIAKAYYQDPSETNRDQWKLLKESILSSEHASNTDLRYIISAPPRRKQIFTTVLILVQIIILIAQCNIHGFAYKAFIGNGKISRPILTFRGYGRLHHRSSVNPWIGPTPEALIRSGAIFGPCIHAPIMENSERRKNFDYLYHFRYRGCCVMDFSPHHPFIATGITTENQCKSLTEGRGNWTNVASCIRPVNDNATYVHLKPCCYGLFGNCMLATRSHCDFMEGTFHAMCDTCNQVYCRSGLCNTWMPAPSQSGFPVVKIRQIYRLLVSLFLTSGLIDLALLVVMELVLMATIERGIGWLRVGLIYIGSGLVGSLLHLVFHPRTPTVGSTAGLMGMVGAVMLEFSQAWNLIDHPKLEGLKILALVALFLFLGTFPLVSFTSVIGGLVAGMITGLILIPYITFGQLGHWRGRVVLLGVFLYIALISGLIDMAFRVSPSLFCNGCDYLECIPYDKHMCRKESFVYTYF